MSGVAKSQSLQFLWLPHLLKGWLGKSSGYLDQELGDKRGFSGGFLDGCDGEQAAMVAEGLSVTCKPRMKGVGMLWGSAISHGAGQERGDAVAEQASEQARSW